MRGADLQPGRFHQASSAWQRSFALDDLKLLVVCRGPVRQEAFQIFGGRRDGSLKVFLDLPTEWSV